MMTLHNINDTERFFSIVNACAGPVTVQSSDGRKEDLRHNTFVKDLLEKSSNGNIAKLQLGFSNSKDVSRVLHYMMYGA